jgi:hypothetical protein
MEGGGCGAVVDFEVGPGGCARWAGSWVEGRGVPVAHRGFACGTVQVLQCEDPGSAPRHVACAASWGR